MSYAISFTGTSRDTWFITSIHDTALAFVPRIVVTFVVFLIVFPWMMKTMVSYTTVLFSSFEPYVH